MGDRAHAVIKSNGEKVYLYTHWRGSDLPGIVKAALRRVPGRWDDAPYLAPAVFCEMLDGNLKEETGFGISASPCEDTRRDITLDVDAGRVTGHNEAGGVIDVTFAQYIT